MTTKIPYTLLADGVDGELITWNAAGQAATVATGTANQVLRSNGAGAAPTFGTAAVAGGGTGVASLTAYAPIFGGTTSTGAVQSGTVGTAGQVLTSNGAGALPTFQAAAGGGDYVLLATATASASATIDFESLITSTYDNYIFFYENIRPANDAVSFTMQTSTNNGTSYDTGIGDYGWNIVGKQLSGATDLASSNTGATSINLNSTVASNLLGNAAAEGISGFVTLVNPLNTTQNKAVFFNSHYLNTSTVSCGITGIAARLATANIDAIRFIMTTGNITSGKIKMYGVKA